MHDQTHSKEVQEFILTEWQHPELVRDGVDTAKYFTAYIKLHPVVAESQQRLAARAAQEWLRMNRSPNGLQKVCPASGIVPIRSQTNQPSSADVPHR